MVSLVCYETTGKVIGAMGKDTFTMRRIVFNGLKMNPMSSLRPPKEKGIQTGFK